MAGAHGAQRRGWLIAAASLGMILLVTAILLSVRAAGPSAEGPASDPPTHSPTSSDPVDSPSPPSPTADPGATSPTPTPSSPPVTDSPAPPVTTSGEIDDEHAQVVVDAYVSAAAELAPDTHDVSARVGTVADASVVAELEADLLELKSQGWTRTGVPVVVFATVVDQDANASPPTATVQACIDSSDVQMLDADGEALPTDPASARALNIYTLIQNDDGSWLIATRSFPSNPSC